MEYDPEEPELFRLDRNQIVQQPNLPILLNNVIEEVLAMENSIIKNIVL